MNRCCLLALLVLVVAGCDQGSSGPATPSTAAAPAPPPPPPPPAPAPVAPDEGPTLQPGDNTVKAEVGVGKKGQGYGGDMITEPLRQYFRATDRVQFDLMARAMRDYKILNERSPKTHDEFMQEIIEKNGIQLPQLRPGEEYVYDAKAGELMVRRPKK